MQLTRHTDYTLRVLLLLAARPDQRITLSEIAKFFDISLEHLRKVVHRLSSMGYLTTYQGRGGGIELAYAPENINVGEVLKRLEGVKPLIDCESLDCRLYPVCTLSNALSHGQKAFFDAMSEFSLADLIADRAMCRELTRDFYPE